MKRLCSLWVALTLQILSPAAWCATADDGPAAARALVAQLEAAWNQHDMAAYGALFHDDAEWINVVGMHWRGKDEVMKAHTSFHETIFKNCQLHGEVAPCRPHGRRPGADGRSRSRPPRPRCPGRKQQRSG